jgi:transcription termination/antitermination protein NusG
MSSVAMELARATASAGLLPSAIAHPWYAVRVRSNFDFSVENSLTSKGYEVFCPAYRARHRHRDRAVTVRVPLFPGYLFCRFDPRHQLPILKTPGVVHVLSMGSTPEPVEESEVGAVRKMVESNLRVQPWPFLQAGDVVQFVDGPLCGLEGILLVEKNQCRLVVSVQILQRSVATEVASDWLKLVRRGPAHVVDRSLKR